MTPSVTGALASAQTLPAPARAITSIGASLHHVQSGDRATVFLVTPDGIVLADPLDPDTATWLAAEIEARFPGTPVRYVLHTSHRYNRAAGAAVFEATAERIGHEAFDRERRRSVEASARVEEVRPVDRSYRSRDTLAIGGRTVYLIHPDGAAAPDATMVLFSEDGVLFAADHPPLTPPDAFAPSTPHRVLRWVRFVNGLDFDQLVSGDGRVLAKVDVEAFERYLDQLISIVRDGVREGLSVPQIEAGWTPGGTTPDAALRRLHVGEVHRQTHLVTVAAYGASMLSTLNRAGAFCASPSHREVTACDTSGGRSPAGVAGLQVSIGRFSGIGELRVGSQFVGDKHERTELPTTTHTLVARRDTQFSFLLRVDAIRRGPVTIGAGGGASFVGGRSIWRVGEGFLAPPDAYQYVSFSARNAWTLGVTAATDVVASVTPTLSVMVPVRFTFVPSRGDAAEWWIASRDVQAGVGVRVTIARFVR